MALPEPVPGLVIRYAYLWLDEYRQGREEGVKDRPCAIILVTGEDDDGKLVTVLPVTYASPKDARFAVEIPAATKARLGMDSAHRLEPRLAGLVLEDPVAGEAAGLDVP